MLSSEAVGAHPNLPSLWSFFNPSNPNNPRHSQTGIVGGGGPQPQMTPVPFPGINHVNELSNFPQHIELEFEESVIRRHPNITNPSSTSNSNIVNQTNATIALGNLSSIQQQQPQTNNNNAPIVDVMRLKSSPDTIAAAAAANHPNLPPPTLATSTIPLVNSTTSASMNSIMPVAISQQGHESFSEPSYCYLQSSIPQQQQQQPHVSHVVTSSTRGLLPAVPPLNNVGGGVIQPPPQQQPFDLSQASTPPFQRCSPDTTSQIPSVSDYSGEYGFTMSYGSSSANVAMSSGKGALWTFSEQTQKLYVKMAATCPVKFQTVHRVPQGCYLRAMSVFKQPEHVKQVVTRCPNHSHGHSKDSFNEGHPAPSHLIRCEHPSAEYQEDAVNGRQSVVVPFDSPQVGTDFVVFLYNFMCYGSCVGGLNRRPIQVVFTLERDGVVLGRRAVEVRICACPSRDRKSEENALNPAYPGQNRRGEKRAGSKALALRDPMAVALNNKRCKLEQTENLQRSATGGDPTTDPSHPGGGGAGDVFYVPVKGLYYYNLVTALYKQLCVHNGDSALFDELIMSSGNNGQNSNDSGGNQNNQSALPSLTMSSETTMTTDNTTNHIKSLSENKECVNDNMSDLNPNGSETPALVETPPVSPIPPSASDFSHLAETSMVSLLSSLGCGYALDYFLSRNILHAGHLAQMSDQEVVDLGLDDVTLSKILSAKRDLENNSRQPGDSNLLGSGLPSGISEGGLGIGNNHENTCYQEQEISLNDSSEQLMIVRTASNSSMTILPNGDLRQTRYTLHHSVSFLKSAGNSFELKPGATLD